MSNRFAVFLGLLLAELSTFLLSLLAATLDSQALSSLSTMGSLG